MLSLRAARLQIARFPAAVGSTAIRWNSSSGAGAEEKLPETVTIVPKIKTLVNGEKYAPDLQLSLLGHLQARHLVEGVSHDELFELTDPTSTAKFKLYCGADPTAKSLHLGNLLPLMVLLHFVLRGHDVVALIGGATGEVGDPSGRTTERAQIAQEERLDNVNRIRQQMVAFLQRGVDYAKSREYPIGKLGKIDSVNNADWWKDVKLLDFLATFGRHIRVSSMLGRDSIQSRLASQTGLGFNEFAYQVLQAYDFWHLFAKENVNMQLGGNDQWGNITAGIDLISRLQRHSHKKDVKEKPAYGITVPLLTTPAGAKFGKSAGNAVFISSEATSPYQLYQFFINTPDEMVVRLLKCFTLLPLSAIDNDIMVQHNEDPAMRIAQRVLAREVTDLVHGVGVGDDMARLTSFLFPTPDQPFDEEVSAEKLLACFRKSGILVKLDEKELEQYDELKLSTLLAKVMNKSRNETKSLIRSGGIYLGLERTQVDDPDDILLFDKENHLIDGKLLLVRSGKQNYYVVEFVNQD